MPYATNYGDAIAGEEYGKTEYNSNQLTIIRIANMENSFIASFLGKDYAQALSILELLYMEYHYKMKDGEKKECDEFILALKNDIYKALETYVNPYSGLKVDRYPQLKADFIDRLTELKKVLNIFKYKIGLGMTDAEDPTRAVLKGF